MMRTSLFLKLFVTLLYALLWAVPVAAQTHHTHQHSFEGAEQWAKEFDDPNRDAWQKPHEVIQALALAPNAVIADIGAGTGYFSMRFAHMVRRAGSTVWTPNLTWSSTLPSAHNARDSKNIIAVHAAPDDPRLREKVDLIIMVDTFHHIEGRDRYFSKLHDSLKPEGRVAIIDFRMDSPDGPPKSARSTPEAITAELHRAGYALVQEHNFLPKQYFLIFQSAKK